MLSRRSVYILALIVSVAVAVWCFPWQVNPGRACWLDSWLHPGERPTMQSGDVMVRRYIVPYGLIWWAALVSIYFLVRELSKSRRGGSQRSSNGQ